MCGRYAFYSDKSQVIRQFDAQIPFDFPPAFNVGPGQNIFILEPSRDGKRVVGNMMKWGVKPKWGGAASKFLINARSETVHDKSTFKKAFNERRCVVVADGWYEWLREKGQKLPYFFFRKDHRLLAFAAIQGKEQDDGVSQGLILTRPAPKHLCHIHDRAPLMLTREQINTWLSPAHFTHVSSRSIEAFDVNMLDYYPVSPKVNSIRNNDIHLTYKHSQ